VEDQQFLLTKPPRIETRKRKKAPSSSLMRTNRDKTPEKKVMIKEQEDDSIIQKEEQPSVDTTLLEASPEPLLPKYQRKVRRRPTQYLY